MVLQATCRDAVASSRTPQAYLMYLLSYRNYCGVLIVVNLNPEFLPKHVDNSGHMLRSPPYF